MKVLHTSDWHIGRKFERESLEKDQQEFLSWLANQIKEQQIDLVVIAGDIYDRSTPAEEAVAVLDEGLDSLLSAGAKVALISGNHDSAARLGFGSRRQALGGVHVFADVHSLPTPWIFEKNNEQLAVLGVPYLEPFGVAHPQPNKDGSPRPRTHQNVLVDALEQGRNELNKHKNIPSLVMAHAFVSGATPSDSEKTLSIGGAELVDAGCFTGFDYVALGHLHRPQIIGSDQNIAYSGSPLPYSFSEGHKKSVRLLDFRDNKLAEITEIEIPIGRPVVTLTNTLSSLLNGRQYHQYQEHWVSVRLTDEISREQPMEQLRERFPNIVNVRYSTVRYGTISRFSGKSKSVESRKPEEVVIEFLTALRRDQEPSKEERMLVHQAVEYAMAEDNQ